MTEIVQYLVVMIFDCFQRSEMNDDRSDRGVGVLVEKFKKRVYYGC